MKLVYEKEIDEIIGLFKKYLVDELGHSFNNLIVIGDECKVELESFLIKFAESVEEGYRENMDREPIHNEGYD
jgi:hypothetical protein